MKNQTLQYDMISDRYDSLFDDKASLDENKAVGAMLPLLSGSVLDIGCGTGLLIEILGISPSEYTGIDPSRGMLSKLKTKHPEYRSRVICSPYTDSILDPSDFDNVISLFGSCSYLSEDILRSLGTSVTRKFLMFYKPDYTPVTYKMCNVDFSHYIYGSDFLADVFRDCSLTEFNNFIIVSNYATKRNDL